MVEQRSPKPRAEGSSPSAPAIFEKLKLRGVAQFGSATGLGPVGRGFKSCHPDHFPSFGPLAQRLEQPAHNRSVLGSTPRWPTIFLRRYPLCEALMGISLLTDDNRFAQIAQLVEQETENLRVPGSIPGLGTNLTLYPVDARFFSCCISLFSPFYPLF